MHCLVQAVWTAGAGEKVAHKEKLCYAIAVKIYARRETL